MHLINIASEWMQLINKRNRIGKYQTELFYEFIRTLLAVANQKAIFKYFLFQWSGSHQKITTYTMYTQNKPNISCKLLILFNLSLRLMFVWNSSWKKVLFLFHFQTLTHYNRKAVNNIQKQVSIQFWQVAWWK